MKKAEVLRNKEDFDRLHNKGKSVGSRFAVVVYLPNHLGYSRKAFLASKKIGNSIVRHRSTRLMKEAFRIIEKDYDVPVGMDFLFIARAAIKDSKCADVKKAIEAAMKKAGILKT